MTTSTQQNAVISVAVDDDFARLRERLRIQRITDPADPDYPKRTRQLLEQLDEYQPKTPCLIVSMAELCRLLGIR